MHEGLLTFAGFPTNLVGKQKANGGHHVCAAIWGGIRERAVIFMNSIVEEVFDRNFVSHAVWDEFVPGAEEPTMDARNIKARKGAQSLIDVGDFRITLTILKSALANANRLNLEMSEFTRLISLLRPLPSANTRL